MTRCREENNYDQVISQWVVYDHTAMMGEQRAACAGNRMQPFYVLAFTTLCLTLPDASYPSPPIPDDPGEEFLVEQSFDTVVGLLFRHYSLRGDGHVDRRTARHIPGISYDDPASEELEVAPHPLCVGKMSIGTRSGVWVDRNEAGTHLQMRRATTGGRRAV